MCLNPVSATIAATSAGLQIGQGISGAKEGQKAARANFVSARESQSNQTRATDRRYVSESRAANQQGYDAALEEAAAAASARNSAAGAGVRGVSVDALINEQLATGARNQSRIQDRRDDASINRLTSAQDINTQTNSRVSSIAAQAPKYGLLDMLIPIAGAAASIQGSEQAARNHRDTLAKVGE